MPKKILLIENDAGFAAEASHALEAAGLEVRTTGDGKEGLDLARDWAPEAIVLCVELPGMSGYLVCQKLKKDDALRSVPLVLTSAEATEETFEKHKTLKARADEYLLKPYAPEALIEKLAGLIGLPDGAAGPGEEEVVSLEEEMGLEASAEGSPDQEIPGLDLQSLPDEPADGGETTALDEDLRLLDDAFEGLSAAGSSAADAADAALDELTGPGEEPVPVAEVDAAAASLPEEDEGAARAELATLDADAEAALGALGGADETLSPDPSTAPVRGASADLLRAAGIRLLDDEPAAAPPPAASSADLDEAREALERARRDLDARDEELRDVTRRADEAEAEIARAGAKAESAAAQLKKAEADARAARDEARRAADQARAVEAKLADLERRLAEAERRAEEAEADARRRGEEAAAAQEAVARAEALEREADELRTELLVARGEAEGARGEVENRTTELRKRVADIEAASAKNEERIVKAYQKIKADEKVRDKVRKALAIATQLLEEGLSAAEPTADKERRAAGGRE
ncbi:MAG TPA: response regulator [Anaeromyxobacter sp.]|nr:response regulator [Anaeromyxobacter sp.]